MYKVYNESTLGRQKPLNPSNLHALSQAWIQTMLRSRESYFDFLKLGSMGNAWSRGFAVCTICRDNSSLVEGDWTEYHRDRRHGMLGGTFTRSGNPTKSWLISAFASNWAKIDLMHLLQSNSALLPCLFGEDAACTRKWTVLREVMHEWWHDGWRTT